MKPYQKPPMEAAVLPATEMIGRPQRPSVPGSRAPPPHYKSRPSSAAAGIFHAGPPAGLHQGPHGHHLLQQQLGVAYPVPAPRSAGSAQGQPGSKLAKPMARYHPSLSGSETDVSTSTENLTQVRQFFEIWRFLKKILSLT